jgi:hypothetical protein
MHDPFVITPTVLWWCKSALPWRRGWKSGVLLPWVGTEDGGILRALWKFRRTVHAQDCPTDNGGRDSVLHQCKMLFPTQVPGRVPPPVAFCILSSDAQIPGARSPLRLYFVLWRLVIVGPQYGTCFTLLFRRLDVWGCYYIFGKFVHTWVRLLPFYSAKQVLYQFLNNKRIDFYKLNTVLIMT